MSAARDVVAAVADPELPVLTLDDLGIVRAVEESPTGVRVTITPTYSGCPAIEAIRDDIRSALTAAGFPDVDVRTVLYPPWTTDWISEAGRRKLAAAGIAPPGPSTRPVGPIPLTLGVPDCVPCPRCGAAVTEELSRFGPTACTALRRCPACAEPFEHLKPL